MLGARIFVAIALAIPSVSHAEPMFTDETWRVSSSGELAIDGGIVVGFPPALSTGLERGIGAGVTWGRRFAIGARVMAATASESSMAWRVTQRDLGARVVGALQQRVGRAELGVRLGLGANYIHESRLRQQGMRAGLTGDALATTEDALLPAANLDAVIAVAIAGPWRLQLSGGPAVLVDDGVRFGWSALVGIAWHP